MAELNQNLLTASFYGSIVILAVLVLRLVLRKAPKKYMCFLWILVGIRLMLPFSIESRLSLQPDPVKLTETFTEIRQEQPVPAPNPATPNVSDEMFEKPGEIVHHAPAVDSQKPEPDDPYEQEAAAKTNWSTVAGIIWMAVASSMILGSGISYVKLKKRVRFAVRVPGGWESPNLDTAFVIGFVNPKIYIPAGMSEESRKFILDHERAHIQRGDHIVKLLAFVVLAIHWFNPLVWLAFILMSQDIELGCDQHVVQFMSLEQRKQYSATLLRCSAHRPSFSCQVAFGEVNVKKRIISILKYHKPGFFISLVCVIAVVFVIVCLVTSPSRDKQPENSPTVFSETSAGAETTETPATTDPDISGVEEKIDTLELDAAEIQKRIEEMVQELTAEDNTDEDYYREYLNRYPVLVQNKQQIKDGVYAQTNIPDDYVCRTSALLRFVIHGQAEYVTVEDGYYSMERWTGSKWESMPYREEYVCWDPVFVEGWGENTVNARLYEWGSIYGILPAGHYRIGVQLLKDSEFCYAEFDIKDQQASDQEITDRCFDTLMEIWEQNSYHVRYQFYAEPEGRIPLPYYGTAQTQNFWKYGTDILKTVETESTANESALSGEMRKNRITYRSAEGSSANIETDSLEWMEDPYVKDYRLESWISDCTYHLRDMEVLSVEDSGRKITLTISPNSAYSNDPKPTGTATFCFAENGKLSSLHIETFFKDQELESCYYDLVVMDTPESEILTAFNRQNINGN